MTQATRGFLAMLACCSIWGLSGMYYKLLTEVPAVEVLAHRTFWCMTFFAVVLGVQGRLTTVLGAVTDYRRTLWLALSAMMISVNWFGFVLAIQKGWAMDASLGYYIFPLMAVLLGRFFLGEKLSGLQSAAVVLAAAAVITLAVGLGVTPWISLLLATTFAMYGLIKRGVDLGPVASVFIEVLILSPVALVFLLASAETGAFGHDMRASLLLIGSGPLTAVPLILFSYAARRINFATMGLAQYINPTLQLIVAVVFFAEPVSQWHAIALPLIWLALALYSYAAFTRLRAPIATVHRPPQ